MMLVAVLLAACNQPKEDFKGTVNIVPKPLNIELQKGYFQISDEIALTTNGAVPGHLVKYFQQHLQDINQVQLITDGNAEQQLTLEIIQDEKLGKEGYLLDISKKEIRIQANEENGLFYGLQSVLQLMHHAKADRNKIAAMKIVDKPQFSWRGMHLDVCRHFMPLEYVKRYIDALAYHKMNSFHWHLTEDQGWRIEIKKYPKLTEIGSKRDGTVVKKNWGTYDGVTHEGFYTQEQIKEVVAYAKERYINVVPEIEMPGHSLAALAGYPELGCTEGPYEVAKDWGVFDDVYCAGNEKTFEFLEDVLDEVVELFPGEYVHVGGDECPKTQWEKCPKCQQRIEDEGLKDEHELQSYFITRMEKYLNAKGKRMIGWDEILEGGLAPNATVMSWRGEKGGIEAAEMGHDVVMSPGSHCYFDHYQGDPEKEPFAIGGYTTVEKVYEYNPIPKELSPEKAKHILGCQGNVWTEYILDGEQMEYMALPRMCALAEVNWLPEDKKDKSDFFTRLEKHLTFLDIYRYNYRKLQ